ncbi:hypothetical protein C7999DRAFT_31938 [Corynascus novoguineensis]|uniref:Uncharacterized protein n=1 Tax=Corynascus novoguineensis TaxID=1126955 RepID=A0AAN7HP51_9PEZI|nr:hypothetical protein C7999DRAFT_31938 [Corynascus novoguineensis]
MTKNNKDLATPAENEICIDVPAGSTAGNAANTLMASGVPRQNVASQNESLVQLAQIPQDQITNFLRLLAGMSTVVQGGNQTNIPPVSSTAGTSRNIQATSSSAQATTDVREGDSPDDLDDTRTHRSHHVIDRSRRDMVSVSADEDLEDSTPRLSRRLTRTIAQQNEHNWVLGDRTLPVAPCSGVAPPSSNPLMYTSYILNNLAGSNPDENLLWSILRAGGGIRYIARLLKVKERPQGPEGTFYPVLKWSRPQQRTAIAAHAKLPQTNHGMSCTACENASSVGPFQSCIATGEFNGGCTNCQYQSRSAQCSLRTGADETGVARSVPELNHPHLDGAVAPVLALIVSAMTMLGSKTRTMITSPKPNQLVPLLGSFAALSSVLSRHPS